MTNLQPYIGPKPFGLEDQKLFFGRDREENDLLALTQAHPVVVLYAQSGAGKTSLLEAKLVPDLYARKAEVFRGVRVGGDLPPGIDIGSVRNVFVFNAVMTLRQNPASAAQLVTTTLPEAFALGRKEAADEDEPLRVAIFDQFEEIFTSHPERWQDREGFFQQVAAALKADPFLHVVFAIREEYLASMMPHANQLPGRLRIGLRLERLRREAAMDAVINPLEGTGRAFSREAAEALVDNLMSNAEFIEPLHLQVVCRNLWQSLDPAAKVITPASIQTYGDLDAALRGYYEECVAKTVAAKQISEGMLRNWFGTELVLPGNKRNLVYQEANDTAGLPNEIVKLLDEQHLIRPELRGGTVWYELAHDRFVRPILDSNASWQKINDAIGLALQEAAERWKSLDGSKRLLLTSSALEEARHWRKGPGRNVWQAGGLLREYIDASENAQMRWRVRAYSIQVIVLVVALAIFAFLFFKAQRAQSAADQLRREAEQTKLVERGLFATSIVESEATRPRQFRALIWGIKAMGPITATPPGAVPPEARKGLQDALRPFSVAMLFLTAPGARPQFLADNVHILTESNGRLDMVDAKSGTPLWRTQLANEVELFYSAISPDSKWILATATFKQAPIAGGNTIPDDPEGKRARRKAWLVSVATGDVAEVPAVSDLIGGFFSGDGNLLVGWKDSAEHKGYRLSILDTSRLQVVREIDRPSLEYIALSGDNRTVATLDSNGTIEFLDLEDNPQQKKKIELREIKDAAGLTLLFSPDGQWLLVTDHLASKLWVFEVATGKQSGAKDAGSSVASYFFTGDSKFVIVVEYRTVLLLDAATAKTKAVRELGNAQNYFLSQDLARVLCLYGQKGHNERLSIVNLLTGAVIELPTRSVPGERFAASADLSLLVTVDGEGTGRIFGLSEPPVDVSTLDDQQLLQLACHQFQVRTEHDTITDDEVRQLCASQK